MTSGYTHCGCRDCFDIAISSDMTKQELCLLCEDADCRVWDGTESSFEWECQRLDGIDIDLEDCECDHNE